MIPTPIRSDRADRFIPHATKKPGTKVGWHPSPGDQFEEDPLHYIFRSCRTDPLPGVQQHRLRMRVESGCNSFVLVALHGLSLSRLPRNGFQKNMGMDKEVFTDFTSNERHVVDLLVKAGFRDRGEAFFLLHVENQSAAQDQFSRRMYRYFSRLNEKFALPVYPVVLLSYDPPQRPEPYSYQVEFPDIRILDFNFRKILLNQLRFIRQKRS